MSPTFEDLLKDASANETSEGSAKTPSPADLETMAKTPATMLWTLELVKNSSEHCWVKAWVRRLRITLAFALGAIAALQVVGLLSLRATLRETVRAAVVEVLQERKIISGENPAPAPTTVANLADAPFWLAWPAQAHAAPAPITQTLSPTK